MKFLPALFIIFFFAFSLSAQQTIFNVPSADVLERGKIYGEFDATYQHSTGTAAFTPRVVVGVGRSVEVGINFNGLATPGKQALTPTPTFKWKIYEDGDKSWSWLAGDDVFIPAQNRTYNAGNYIWTEAARTWRSGTRLTFGVYHASANVFGAKQKLGGQFAFEQPLSRRVTFATDWFTGDSTIGYVTPGVILKLSNRLTWYGSYQLGNHRLSNGNHQFLFELGWNVN